LPLLREVPHPSLIVGLSNEIAFVQDNDSPLLLDELFEVPAC
jgi:hypothetical protein